MIDEKVLLETLEIRERKHREDYELFSDSPEAQEIVGHCLQELQEIRELINTQSKIKWLPFPQYVPKNLQMCLVTRELGVFSIMEPALYFCGRFWNGRKLIYAVAWQPLPEPYKEKKND